ncbi:MAG: ATP-binding protein [Lachnospiraceae bacterium]
MSKKKYSKTELPIKLNIALLMVIIFLIGWGIILIRDKILNNANVMGNYLAQSYADEEEKRISVYKMFMQLGANYISENIANGSTGEDIQKWLSRYSSQVERLFGGAIIDPYVIVDGEIIAAKPWIGDDNYNYADTEWYEKTIEADGDIIFTDAYEDAITGKYVITISVKIDDDDNIFAADILLENFHMYKNKKSIPADSSYFLFDSSGKLLYMLSDLSIDDESTREYAKNLREGIENGEYLKYDSSITDLEGKQRGIYYYYMENGWLSVITIPLEQIFQEDMDNFIFVIAVIGVIIFITIAAFLIREYIRERKIKYTVQTLQILGDTYYAIYRINYKSGTYLSIKSSDDVKEYLGDSGQYQKLIDVVKGFVEEKTYKEFEKSFSIENIQELVNSHIYEFGGDYKRRFGDEYKWVSIRIIYSESLGLNEVLMCFREIDSEKKRQIQHSTLLESTLESMKKMTKQKSIFFSNMSHDMRTPLNAIVGLTELAKRNPDDMVKVMEYMDKIQMSGNQLLNLINDILDMSKLELGRGMMLEYKPMNLKKCIEDSAAIFHEQAKSENKSLNVVIDIEKTMVYGDSFRLNQILNNLISNSLKYSNEGADITVTLRQLACENNRGKYQIKVKDTGIGMSQKFLGELFEPFARETTFSPINVQGTGLGMSIVKSLVQQMSGEIDVESRLGEGSTFTITLPLQIVEKEQETTQDNLASDKVMIKGKTILIAEDNEINMEISTELLTMMGAKVIQAWNGREALEIFEASQINSIDIILMDMQMPVMDGCTSCREIRSLERNDAKTVPIIAVTANAFAEDVAETAKAGMNAHISKPIDFNLLCDELSRISSKGTENFL